MDTRTSLLSFFFFLFSISSCGEPETISRDNRSPRTPLPETMTQSFIVAEGGSISSIDGVFSVLVSEGTFNSAVTITIEKLTIAADADPAILSSTYRVRYLPSGLEVSAENPLQIQFKLSEEVSFTVETENMRITYREFEEGLFQHNLDISDEDGKVRSDTQIMNADFALVEYHASDEVEDSESAPSNEPSSTDCNAAEFSCDDGNLCLPQLYVCDGNQECADGSDESPVLCNSQDTFESDAGDAFEPDNSFSQVSSISGGETQNRNLTLFDVDFIRFELSQPSDVTIRAMSEFNGERVVVQLFTADHTELDQASEYLWADPTEAKIRAGLEAGIYYLAVSPVPGHNVFDYSISLTTGPRLPDPPQNLTANHLATRVELSWDPVEEAQGYRVYYGETSGYYTSSSWYFALEGDSPVEVTTNSAVLSALPNYYHLYVVVVALIDGEETIPSQELIVLMNPMNDEFEPNNSFETATPLHTSSISTGSYHQLHNANESGDRDYVIFELEGDDNSILLETTGQPWIDTYLELFNSSQEVIAVNDNQEPYDANVKLSRITTDHLSPGIYYGLARPAYENGSYGTYGIKLTVE